MMSEKQSSNPDPANVRNIFWDTQSKKWAVLLGPLLVIGSVFAFLWQAHNDLELRESDLKWQKEQKERQVKIDARESKKAFLEAQLRIYERTAAAVSEIAEDKGDANVFRELFHGSMPIVEDRRVELMMLLFAKAKAMPGNTVCVPNTDTGFAREISLTLAHCMKVSIADSWDFEHDADEYCNMERVEQMAKRCKVELTEPTRSLFKRIQPVPATMKSDTKMSN
jgi:hypothetical protein